MSLAYNNSNVYLSVFTCLFASEQVWYLVVSTLRAERINVTRRFDNLHIDIFVLFFWWTQQINANFRIENQIKPLLIGH